MVTANATEEEEGEEEGEATREDILWELMEMERKVDSIAELAVVNVGEEVAEDLRAELVGTKQNDGSLLAVLD